MSSPSGSSAREALPVRISGEDETLQGLVGVSIRSDVQDGVVYVPEQALGRGGGSVAFLAMRVSSAGTVPVVVKVLRPSFVKRLGSTAYLLIKKEAVALGRLNEQVPPTPYVIRLVDTGNLLLEIAGAAVEVPWVAVEYVHGGGLGTTLSQRVRRSLRDTGYAFGVARAANAIDCIANGLAAVHDVGVFHRDLTPNNILCTGRARDETLKIADFGVARPLGVKGSLAGALVGTTGYAAPELSFGADADIGPHTDVFSFASIIFFMLTGEPLFGSSSEVLRAVQTPARRSLLDMPALSPELRADESACRAIDHVLAWASAGSIEARLTQPLALSAMLLPHLIGSHSAPESIAPYDLSTSVPTEWAWSVLHHPGEDVVICNVAWDGNARAIAATSRGLSFWSGTSFRNALAEGLELSGGARFVCRLGAGKWLLGLDEALAIYSTGGVASVVETPRTSASMEAFGGDLDDLGVLVSRNDAGDLALHTFASKRWFRPVALARAKSVSAIARFDERRFIVVGRDTEGSAFAALYSALEGELEKLDGPTDARALIACAARTKTRTAYAVGTQGAVFIREGDSSVIEQIEGEPSLSAVAVDPFGRPWAASASKIFMRTDGGVWTRVYENSAIESPIVSLFLDVGLCVAMTADGAVIEGRSSTALKIPSDLPPPPSTE